MRLYNDEAARTRALRPSQGDVHAVHVDEPAIISDGLLLILTNAVPACMDVFLNHANRSIFFSNLFFFQTPSYKLVCRRKHTANTDTEDPDPYLWVQMLITTQP
jgi:hypothetical protein